VGQSFIWMVVFIKIKTLTNETDALQVYAIQRTNRTSQCIYLDTIRSDKGKFALTTDRKAANFWT